MSDATSERRPCALVFGGSCGIGAAIAVRLARDDYRIALTYVSSPDEAEEVVSEIRDKGGDAMAILGDSADPAAIRAAVAKTEESFGGLDVVVVNAGVLRLARLEDLSLADLDLMLAVNVRGVVLAIQAATGFMCDGGLIITIGSNTAVRAGSAVGAVYAMTKAAVASLVGGLALDLAPRGIRVNNVQPGPTQTDMTRDSLDRLKDIIPLRRVVQPEEAAGLVSYLAGHETASITGASFTMDGGFVL